MVSTINAVILSNGTIYQEYSSNTTIQLTCDLYCDSLEINETLGRIIFYNPISACISNINDTYDASVGFSGANQPSVTYSNGTNIYNSSSNATLNFNIPHNQGINLGTNATQFQVNYTYTYNLNDQSGYSGGTTFISNGIIGMVVNFFSLSPVTGTIFGLCILIAGIVILIIYIKRFNNKSINSENYKGFSG